MLDLPGQPLLDKRAMIGGCIRLPVTVDAKRLRAEVAALPDSLWGTTGGRVGVHSAADAVFLRGFAPAEGPKSIEDRPPLQLLPYIQSIIAQLLPGKPQRCLLARLPAGATIPPHTDRAPYFSQTVRIHVPVETHDKVWMVAAQLAYVMKPGESWALNNSTTHAVWNAGRDGERTHLICDFLPTEALLDLLERGERDLGRRVAEVEQHFAAVNAAAMLHGRRAATAAPR